MSLNPNTINRRFKLFSWQQQSFVVVVFCCFFAGRALYIKFRDVFGLILTQVDATILIFIKACCWNTLFILIYLYCIENNTYKLHGCKDDVTHHDCIGCLICVSFKHA